MATKYYAVRKGRETGIFTDWDKTKVLVDGYPGAEYKSFKTPEGAEAYLKGESYEDSEKEKANNITIKGSMSDFEKKYKIEQKAEYKKRKTKNEKSLHREPILSLGGSITYNKKDWSRDNAKTDIYKYIGKKVVAYTDGSYNDKTDYSGYGIIYFARNNPNREPITISGKLHSTKMHQIVGEIKAVEVAVKRAIDEKRSHIEIRYDYEGVEKWATGEWKANKKRTQEYKARIQEYSKQIQISFSKVDAHTGDIFNEEADMCAKKACGLI